MPIYLIPVRAVSDLDRLNGVLVLNKSIFSRYLIIGSNFAENPQQIFSCKRKNIKISLKKESISSCTFSVLQMLFMKLLMSIMNI